VSAGEKNNQYDVGHEEERVLRLLQRRSQRWLVLMFSGAAFATSCLALGPSTIARGATAAVNVFPIPGGRVAAPSSQITFRGIPSGQLGAIAVTGSVSGPHTGRVLAHSDGRGGSFVPAAPFRAGETVTVRTGLNIVGGTGGAFSFKIASPAGGIRARAPVPTKRVRGDVWRFASRHDLTPAAVKVTHKGTRAVRGDAFIASQTGPLQNGPMILGRYGGLIWYKPMPRGQSATDFRTQTYRGKPVLTWWQGTVSAAGVGSGEDEIYDSSYRPVATVRAGNGLNSDLHEFQLTPQNTALVTAYYPVYWDASSAGGSKQAIVLDSVVQEIEPDTGLVLFQWDSLDHDPLTDSYQPRPKDPGHPWDYFHLNSIQQAEDGSLLLSSRDDWAGYDVSHATGQTVWILGGKRSSFKMGPNTQFAFQHDIRLRANNRVTVFDDGAGPPVVHKQSRALTLAIDTKKMTATLVSQHEHRPALLAAYEGNMQQLPGGHEFVGWGQQPYFTEFDSQGQMVFDARYVGTNSSYRGYRLVWTGTPAIFPSVATATRRGTTTVYASWNGSTSLRGWRVLSGSNPNSLKAVRARGKQGFETSIRITHAGRYVAAQALDVDGRVLAVSKATKVS
jgi:hypothetical protein